jgi:Flp pilus assembly pilin Flp
MVLARAFKRLLLEDAGQDLIEYALLSGFIGLAGVAAWSGIGAVMHTAYGSWVDHANADADMPEPP